MSRNKRKKNAGGGKRKSRSTERAPDSAAVADGEEYIDFRTAGLVSLGCAKNLVDSEKLMAALAQAGFALCEDPSDAQDVVVINTCAFIGPAVEESQGAIEEQLARKAAGELKRVIVAGCLPGRGTQGADDAKLLANVDGWLGPFQRDELPALLARLDRAGDNSKPPGTKAPRRIPAAVAYTQNDRARLRLTPRHTAYLRIADGCNHACSFCTIPGIRGKYRSKPPAEVMAEAEELVTDGARELVLIAQDTSAYGRDLGRKDARPNLAELLRNLDKLSASGLDWLRVMYAYPTTVDAELLAAMAELPTVLPYLDLPLQHISDAVLRSMRRGYGRQEIDKIFNDISKLSIDPDAGGFTVRTTFIVGYPGESESDFSQLCQWVNDAPPELARIGAFTYQPEPGTPAFNIEDRLPAKERQARFEHFMEIAESRLRRLQEARVGQTINVLVDFAKGDSEGGRFVGRTSADAPDVDCVVIGKAASILPGDLLPMRIQALEPDSGLDLLAVP